MSDSEGHSLLRDRIFSVVGDGPPEASLPEVLAGLTRGDVGGFAALQAHQTHAWHVFLVQLAALALERTGAEAPWEEPEPWIDALAELGGGESAWCLVVADLRAPAFLQPPVPEGSLAPLKNEVTAPDGLDVLVTAKGHDVKRLRFVDPRPEHWAFALMMLQTTEGYSGSLNYGIARMNGGAGSRSVLGLTPGLSWPERFRHHLGIARSARARLLGEGDRYSSSGHALLWTLPWTGEDALSPSECDPLFIEIGRRVRLLRSDEGLVARSGNSTCSRVDGKPFKGNLGDPWIPVDLKKEAALTVSQRGFHYELLHKILLGGDYQVPAALGQDALPEGGWLEAQVLARGQGETSGLHVRRLPVPARIVSLLSEPTERDRLAELARDRVDSVGRLRGKVLYPALRALGDGADTRRWLRELDAAVDAIFFEHLWRDATADPDEARQRWREELVELGRNLLIRAQAATPLPSLRRYRLLAESDHRFFGGVRRHLPSTDEVAA